MTNKCSVHYVMVLCVWEKEKEREREPFHSSLILLSHTLSLSRILWWYSNICTAKKAEGVRAQSRSGNAGKWERRLVVIIQGTSRAGFMARSCWVADRRVRSSSAAASQAACTSPSSAYCCIRKRTAVPPHRSVSTLPPIRHLPIWLLLSIFCVFYSLLFV